MQPKYILKYTLLLLAIRKVPANHQGMKLNGTHHLVAYTHDINLLGESINTTQKTTAALVVTSKLVGIETWFLMFTAGSKNTSLNLYQKPLQWISFKQNIQHNNKTKETELST